MTNTGESVFASFFSPHPNCICSTLHFPRPKRFFPPYDSSLQQEEISGSCFASGADNSACSDIDVIAIPA